MTRSYRLWCASGLAGLSFCSLVDAQVTKADYARAAGLTAKYRDLTENVADVPTWLEDGDAMVYSKTVQGGHEFVIADANNGAKRPAFDQARLAAGLNSVAHTDFKPLTLPFTRVQLVDHQAAVVFMAEQQRWRCDLQSYHCTQPVNAEGRGSRDDHGLAP